MSIEPPGYYDEPDDRHCPECVKESGTMPCSPDTCDRFDHYPCYRHLAEARAEEAERESDWRREEGLLR